MNKTYLIIWQKSHTHNVLNVPVSAENISVSGSNEWKLPNYNPTEAGRIETPIDVYIAETSRADSIYEAILVALEKKVEYDRKQIIIHGVFLL